MPADTNEIILKEALCWRQLNEKTINEFIDEYECDTDVGGYTPTDSERFLIKDAIMGLLASVEESVK